MKRLVLVLSAALAVSASLPAQQASFLDFNRATQPFFAPEGSNASQANLIPTLAVPAAATPGSSFSAASSAALPDAPRVPQFGGGGDFGYRWDLATGYEYVHF